METPEKLRLNKYLALQLGISRREADDLISAKKVAVNGTPISLGARITSADNVTVNGKPVNTSTALQYLLLNKPAGYVCSRKPQGDTPTIYSLLPKQYHTLKPVGRLDKDSSGLILLTNDGDFAFHMTHPSFHKMKVYEAQLDKPLEPLHQQMISDYGVILPDGPSKFLLSRIERHPGALGADYLEPEPSEAPGTSARRGAKAGDGGSSHTKMGSNNRGENNGSGEFYEIHMSEGRNRQIRRTFAALGYTVIALHRTQFGNYSLGDIKSGEHTLTNIQ